MSQSQPDSGCWIYRCDDIVIEPRAHCLERAGIEVSVEPKVYAVLVALVQQAGDVVGKDDLLDAAWGHRHVTPGVITRAISQLRHALGDCAGHPRYIATVHSLGYRFIGEVRRITVPVMPTEPAPNPPRAESLVGGYASPRSTELLTTPTAKRRPRALHGLAAAITLAVIVAMLAVASLWRPPHGPLSRPHITPRPAWVMMPFAHITDPRTLRPRRWPHTRRIATVYAADYGESPAEPLASGYLVLRPEHAPAAQQ